MIGVIDADSEGRVRQRYLRVENYPDSAVSHHLSSVGQPIINHIGLQNPSVQVQINSYKRIWITSHTHRLTKLQIYDGLIVLCPCGGCEGERGLTGSHISIANLASAIIDIVVRWTLSDTGKIIKIGITT